MSEIFIRPAESSDCRLLHELILELARYERLEAAVLSTPEMLEEALFGKLPAGEALVAEIDGTGIGFALYFHNFSTFVGRKGLYLEDLYVKETHRGRGVGKALLVALARVARERNCGRMEWSVLDWNQPAIDFYESIGADVMSDWRITRLDTEGIVRLAELG